MAAMAESLAGDDFRDDFKKIGRELQGVEWFVGTVLYLLWYFLLSYWLSHSPRIRKERRRFVIELYVVFCLVATIANWFFGPCFWVSVLCSYFAASTIVTLLQVLFLSKIFGDMESPERSLFLFICNVVQIVFMFACWYQLLGAAHTRDDALFTSMLVLATAGYPQDVHGIVELQIASDLVLVAVFLSHVLGKIGRRFG
jgi:hypothetical protein